MPKLHLKKLFSLVLVALAGIFFLGWALTGLAECLERRGQKEEAVAVRGQFRDAWARAERLENLRPALAIDAAAEDAVHRALNEQILGAAVRVAGRFDA